MLKEDKYYYINSISAYSQSIPQVVRWNSNYYVEVDENVDYHQYLCISINKMKDQSIVTKPKSSEWSKVRPIIKEIFLNHYTLAVKYIHETKILEGEFYIQKNSKDWYQVAYFSKDEKNKQLIEIDFRDAIESLYLSINCASGHKNRPYYRKKGTPITIEKFQQFLNCTIQLLYDSDSYLVFVDDYLRKFYQLIENNNTFEGFIISAEKSFESILNQLQLRIEEIEKRLIQNDSDTLQDRSKLRGELEGISYAIKTIQINS